MPFNGEEFLRLSYDQKLKTFHAAASEYQELAAMIANATEAQPRPKRTGSLFKAATALAESGKLGKTSVLNTLFGINGPEIVAGLNSEIATENLAHLRKTLDDFSKVNTQIQKAKDAIIKAATAADGSKMQSLQTQAGLIMKGVMNEINIALNQLRDSQEFFSKGAIAEGRRGSAAVVGSALKDVASGAGTALKKLTRGKKEVERPSSPPDINGPILNRADSAKLNLLASEAAKRAGQMPPPPQVASNPGAKPPPLPPRKTKS